LQEFVQLRNEIISSLISELNISKEKFNIEVQRGLSNPLHFSAFNQIKLIEDYHLFKNILKKRNQKFNEEIKKQLQESSISYSNKEEDEELQKAIKESLFLKNEASLKEAQEQEELENILKLSKAEYEEYLKQIQKQRKNTQMKISHYKEQEEEKVNLPKHQDKNLFKIKSKTHEGLIFQF